jgi:hypothetical protein
MGFGVRAPGFGPDLRSRHGVFLYLLDLSSRLGFLRPEVYREFDAKYSSLLGQLRSLFNSLEGKG